MAHRWIAPDTPGIPGWDSGVFAGALFGAMAVEVDRVVPENRAVPGDRGYSGAAWDDGAGAVGIDLAWNCVGKTHPVEGCNGYTWLITCLTVT